MDRPILKLPKTTGERIWDIIGGVIFLCSIVYIIVIWGSLPDRVPMHFNVAGEVDRIGSKYEMIILPLIGIGLWMFLDVLERKPHLHNYPARLNESNAAAFYLLSRKMMNVIKNLCLILFAFISFEIVQVSLGKVDALGIWFLLVIIITTLIPIIIVGVKQRKIQ